MENLNAVVRKNKKKKKLTLMTCTFDAPRYNHSLKIKN